MQSSAMQLSAIRALAGIGFRGRRRSRQLRAARGFTLIEIMVVVIIIGLLAAVIVPQIFGRVDDARIAKSKSDIQAIETALTMYKLDNFKYPTAEQGLTALVQKPNDPTVHNWREGGYLKRVNKDPWGNDYQYRFPGTHGSEYDLFSMGPNGVPDDAQGGQSDDIGNWNLDR
jgi:general secretion pathway protein G